MYQPNLSEPNPSWHRTKENERNFLTAFMHMVSISLLCTALVQLGWLQNNGGDCLPRLVSAKYLSFTDSDGEELRLPIYVNDVELTNGDADCSTEEIINLMRLAVSLNLLAIILSTFGFFLDIISPTNRKLKIMRRYALPGILTVLSITGIISVCYYISMVLDTSLPKKYPDYIVHLEYGPGFYTITAAGVVSALGTGVTFLLAPMPHDDLQEDQLIDSWEDLETFEPETHVSPPPPPYTP